MEEKKVDDVLESKQNDLSDIVLEKTDIKADKVKTMLLTIASLILVFLIVLVVMKMLNQQDIQDELPKLQITEEKVAIENNRQPIPVSEESKEEDSLFKQIPILNEDTKADNDIKDTNEKFEEMVRKLKEQEELKTKPAETEVIDAKLDKFEKDLQSVRPNVKEQKPSQIEAPQEIVVNTKEVPVQESKKVSTMNGYFVQVGATYGSYPNKNFLNNLKNKQFNYIIHQVVINGKDVRKVLVGPYSSRAAAQNALADIKQKINKDAFIYRLK